MCDATLASAFKFAPSSGLEDTLAKPWFLRVLSPKSTSILSSPHNSITSTPSPRTSPKPSSPSRPSDDSIQPAIDVSPRAHSALTTDAYLRERGWHDARRAVTRRTPLWAGSSRHGTYRGWACINDCARFVDCARRTTVTGYAWGWNVLALGRRRTEWYGGGVGRVRDLLCGTFVVGPWISSGAPSLSRLSGCMR